MAKQKTKNLRFGVVNSVGRDEPTPTKLGFGGVVGGDALAALGGRAVFGCAALIRVGVGGEFVLLCAPSDNRVNGFEAAGAERRGSVSGGAAERAASFGGGTSACSSCGRGGAMGNTFEGDVG